MNTKTILLAGGLLLAVVLIGVVIVPERVSDDPEPSQRPSPTGAPSSAGEASTDPVVFGSEVFAVWSKRDQAYEAWWTELQPYLDEAAVAAYRGTDPAEIPDVKVNGDLSVDEEPPDLPGLSAMVRVPTTGGEFGLFLVRVEESSPWRLLRINFPEGGSKA